MTRRAIVLLGAAVIACGIWLEAQAPTPSFRARADLVSVEVNVRRNFAPLADLKAEDFEVLDNGVAQQLADLSYGKLPIDITIALDVSQSVSGALLTQLRTGVQQLIPDLGPNDRLKLMTFNMRVRRVLDMGKTSASVAAALDQVRPSGSTAIFDTIAVALTNPVDEERRHLILVFSDGRDSSSTTDLDTLLDVVHRTRPTVGFVLSMPAMVSAPPIAIPPLGTVRFDANYLPFAGRSSGASPAIPRETYDKIARESGGTVLADSRDLTGAFRRLLDDFRTSYVLYYRPTGIEAERPGLHTLDVRVKRALATVRARRSYEW